MFKPTRLKTISTSALAIILSVATPIALTGCGGGGNSSSNGGATVPPVVPPPPPPPPPSSADELPDLFEASFPENGGFAEFETPAFSFTAPDDDLPNLSLVGVDATPFTATLDISAPDTDGVRQIIMRIGTSDSFNFEDPLDEDRDNIYEFEITGDYKGDPLSADIEVTITDVLDEAEASAVKFNGEDGNPGFGIPLMRLPDYTGDGNFEIAVSNITGSGPASAYTITSDFLSANTEASLTMDETLNTGARFTTESNFDVGPVPHILSSLNQADGSGVDMLLSTAENFSSKLYLIPLEDAADVTAIDGNTDPSTIPDTISYTFNETDGSPRAQLIGDVNGDGLNDIGAIFIDGTDNIGRAGIIFGRIRPADGSTIAADLDVTFETSSEFFTQGFGNPEPMIQMISDVDGDGLSDMIISQPNFGNENVFYLKSAALGTASATAIDLDNLNLNTQGFKLRNHTLRSLTEGPDYDADGIPTLLFFADTNELIAIDGDDFAASDPENLQRLYGDTSSTLTASQFMGDGVMVSDLNDDGFPELLGTSRFRQAVQVLDGSVLKNAVVDNPGSYNDGVSVFEVDLINFVAGNFDLTDAPLYLPNQGLYVAAYGSSNQTVIDSGTVVVFKESDVKDAYLSGATGLTLR